MCWLNNHLHTDVTLVWLYFHPSVCFYSQLMVIPSSTPGFFGSFTWNVPELGMTDSEDGEKQKDSMC